MHFFPNDPVPPVINNVLLFSIVSSLVLCDMVPLPSHLVNGPHFYIFPLFQSDDSIPRNSFIDNAAIDTRHRVHTGNQDFVIG